MPQDDLARVREMVRHVASDSGVLAMQAHRVRKLCEQLRAMAAGQELTAAQDAELHRLLSDDLLDRDTPELIPRLWHELEADPALRVLIDRVEAAGEIFDTGQGRLLALVIPMAVRLTSFTERRWRVPLTDQAGRWPLGTALRKRLGAARCVMDAHMYDGPMLAALGPKHVRRHLLSLLQSEGSSRVHDPVVEPIVVHALPEPHWNVVLSVGVALYERGKPLILPELRTGALNDMHFGCEIAFPLRPERLAASRIGLHVKCQGIRAWHDGLRLGSDALRRYRLDQQQWTGDSARHMASTDALDRLRRLAARVDPDKPPSV